MHYFVGMNYLNERKLNIQLCSLFLLYDLEGLILHVNFSNCLLPVRSFFLSFTSFYCLLKSVSFYAR